MGEGEKMDQRSNVFLKVAASVAGGTALAGGASQAEAAIVSGEFQTNGSSQVSNTTTPPNESYSFDFNGDTVNDFKVSSDYSKSKPGAPEDKTKYYTYKGDVVEAIGPDSAIANSFFSPGEEIGTSASFNTAGNLSATYDNGNPSPYFGIRFGATAPYNYGWIQLREGTEPGAWDLVAYAYETTPDTPIAAGAVPEPASLSLLALGAAGAMLRRGKRA
jgi:hypothetical protein